MKKTFLTILLVILLLQLGFPQYNGSVALRDIPLLKHFESTDFKGGIQSWSFDQDSSGFLYVANNNGLLEFDGSTWKLFEIPNCPKVRAVLVDDENKIFVGGQGQIGYFKMSVHGLVFHSLLNKLPKEYQKVSETWKILQHHEEILFNTESQLIAFNGTDLKVLELPGYIRQICKVGDRSIVQVYDLGLFEYANGEFFPIEGTNGLPDLIAIIKNEDNYLYFGRSGKVFKHSETGIIDLNLPMDLGTVNDVIELNSGVYALGTQNKGIFFLNPDLTFKQHLTKKEGLTDRTVKALYEDKFQNLWVALNNGIDYLELSLPLSLINDEVGLDGTGYAACVFDDHIYLGTNNGLFVQKITRRDIEGRKYELVPNSDGQVYNFSKIDRELILHHNQGVFQVKGTVINRIHDIGSWKFMKTKIPGLILGGDYQGISFFKTRNGEWAKVGVVPGLNESSRIMEFENDSILWMTHGTKGAFRLQFDNAMNFKNEITLYGEKNGFPSDLKIDVYNLNNKLVFTSEEGIFNFDNSLQYFVPNTFFNTLLGLEHVSTLVSNNGNAIYYIQNQKLGLLSQEAFRTYRIDTAFFKHVNKFLNDDLENISILDNRNVLIGAKEGFIKYDPQKIFLINNDFHVVLRSVEITSSPDSSVLLCPSLAGYLEINNNQSIKFHYAAPYFDGFEDIKYSYRLVPLDLNWSKWAKPGEKEYPYLPPDDYTFEVKAINIYGVESSLSSFSFEVLTPWYYSSWAILAYLFLGLAILTLVPILQRKRHRTEKSIIVRDKDQAIEIKNEEINQISKESKSEIDKLLNEKLRTEIDLKNGQLTTITMHLMNRSEIMQDVRRKIEINLTQDGAEQDLRDIIKTIDEDLSNNDSWDQFAYHFDQVHGDYLKKLSENNIKLSPREIKLAAFLRMNMSSKEISNLMNITSRSVELARHRLRKKLKLDRDQNLVEYLIDLDNT